VPPHGIEAGAGSQPCPSSVPVPEQFPVDVQVMELWLPEMQRPLSQTESAPQ
jgi:hypothetical protein